MQSSIEFREQPVPLSAGNRRSPLSALHDFHDMTEQQVRTFLWSKLVRAGKKHSYQGTVPFSTVTMRRRKSKAAKIARRANRG